MSAHLIPVRHHFLRKTLINTLLITLLGLSGCISGGTGDEAPPSNTNGPVSDPVDNSDSTTTDPTDSTSEESGTKGQPIALAYPGDLPFADSFVLAETERYYKLSGLQPLQHYIVRLETDHSLTTMVYGSSELLEGVCSAWLSEMSGKSCVAQASKSGGLYIGVFPTWIIPDGAEFTLHIEPATFEATPSAPKDITGLLPYTADTKAFLNNYYLIRGLTPGNAYRANITSTAISAPSVTVYQDQFLNGFCCDFTAASDTVWVRVTGSNADASFTLSLVDEGLPPRVYLPEGEIGSEIELTEGNFYSGQTDNTASHYHVSGLVPNKQYRVALESSAEDTVRLFVYNESSYTTPACEGTSSGLGFFTKDRACVASASDTGELWIKVDGSTAYRYLGASYGLTTLPFFSNEGTSLEAKELPFGVAFSHAGTVDSTSNYLTTGLEPNQAYSISLADYQSNSLSFTVALPNYVPGCFSNQLDVGPQTCILTTNDDGALAIKVYESDVFRGTAFTLDVGLSPYQSEGTSITPVLLETGSAQLPYSGQIGGARSYYEITGLVPDQAYTVTVNGLEDHNYYVYTNDQNLWQTADGMYACKGYSSRPSCTKRAATTSLWVMVDNDVTGASYTLDVVLSPYQAEGAPEQPVELYAATALPYAGSVDITASYYEITGLTAGQAYVITAANADSLDYLYLYTYNDSINLGSTNYGEYQCQASFREGADRYCTVTPTGSSIWVMVKGDSWGIGSRYDLNAALATLAESKTIDFAAGDFPYSGTVDETHSTYTISGLLPQQPYQVSLTNMSADLDLAVTDYISSSTEPCAVESGTNDEVCSYTTYDSRMIIQVRGDKTLHGGSFTLGLTAGPANQGTSDAPVELVGASSFPINSEVGAGSSYYRVTGLTPGGLYAIRLYNLTNSSDLYVYNNDSYYAACSSKETGTLEELCGATASAGGDLTIRVSGNQNGATFTLDLTEGPTSEGSEGNEIPLSYSGGDFPYAGSVDMSGSYYQITGLGSNSSYTISLSGVTGEVMVYAYPDATYTLSGTSCSYSSGSADSCTFTTNPGGTQSAFIHISGTSSVVGSTYNIDLTPNY